MNCREFNDFLMAYLDGELEATERAGFEQHLNACPPCVTYVKQYEDTVRLGKSLCESDDDPIPEDVPERLVQAVLRALTSRP